MVTAVAAPAAAPTATDAAAAAAALVATGVEEVFLFGSVARGDAGEFSDIDLVALYADIDYAQRSDLKRRLEETARSAVERWPVQIFVTDRPEWSRRIANVSVSFERRISSEAVPVGDAGVRGAVRWDKEMVRPMSNPDEALRHFSDRVLTRLSELRASVTRQIEEDDSSSPPFGGETARLRRMVRICEDAAVAVELALKTLAVLHGTPTPAEKELRDAGHNIEKCLHLVPEPPRGAVEGVVRGLGLDLRAMSRWRVLATYVDDVDVERAEADRLAEGYVETALAVCGFVMECIEEVLGDTPAVRAASTEWRLSAEFVAARDVRSGHPTSDVQDREGP